MARRPPGQVRVNLPRRLRPGQGRTIVSGVSARAQSEIAKFEDACLWPAAIADAVMRWSGTVHGPARSLTVPEFRGCGVEACCPPDTHPRKLLAQALRGLPPSGSRELRRLVQPLDDLYCSRTIVDSYADPSDAWWLRRC
ncbi:hypothetical protein GCM10010411_75710 [Actinomadura fulvescens]|uniref:Uncharacterized protein n=1 Tax=Actinomadura fulvescens TaxID=46160 RepID=A0ABP6CYG7_9ACTN